MDILKELEPIFQDVFDDEDIKLTETTNAEDIEDWDSLMQIRIIMAIEKRFKIKFALNEIHQLENVGDMAKIIKNKL